MSGYELVTHDGTYTETTANTVNRIGDDAVCPTGKVAIGGGANGGLVLNNTAQGAADLLESYPFLHAGQWRWSATLGRPDGGFFVPGQRIDYTIFAVCITG